MTVKNILPKIAICVIIIGMLLYSANGSAGESEFGSATPSPMIKPQDSPFSNLSTPIPSNSNNLNITSGVIELVVPSNVQWVNTGLYVNAGDYLTISAIGSWNPGLPATGPVGPDGSSLSWPDNFLNLTDIGTCMYCAQTQTPYWAALIGYIGNMPPGSGSYTSPSILEEGQKIFVVGSQFNNSVFLTGTLWLNFNDDAYSGYTVDNSGSVNVTISYTTTRQDLINAYANLRDEIKSAIISDRNLVVDMDTKYTKAVSPQWGKLAFQEVVDLMVSPESFGVDGLALTEYLEPFHYLNTGIDIGKGIKNVMDDLGINPSEDEIITHFQDYYDNQIKLNPYINGSASHIGINQLLSDVDNVYMDRISRLPDPLPANYPLQIAISLLQEQAAAIRTSQQQETSVPNYSTVTNQCIEFKIGALTTHKNVMDTLEPIYGVQEKVSIGLTMIKLGTISLGLLVKGVSAFAIPVTLGGSTITLYASEPVVWGTVGNVLAYSNAVESINDVSQFGIRSAMAITAVQGSHQAVMDLLMKYQIFSDAGDWMVSVGTQTVLPAKQSFISNEGDLVIIGVNSPNIPLSANQSVGTGQGEITVQNNGGLSITASAIGDIYALLNKNQETIVGMIASDTPKVIPPGEQGILTFQYQVFRTSLVDSSGYRLSITAGGTDSTGIPQFSTPGSSHFYAGTPEQLSVLNTQAFKIPLSGQLPPGLPSNTYFTTQTTTQKVRFDLHVSAGSNFDLHLYDSLGRHTGFMYNTRQVETNIPGSAYSGNMTSPQWISVNQSSPQTYRIVVVAINVDGGNSYYVTSIETPQLPALLDVTPSIFLNAEVSNYSIPFDFSVNEYGGFTGISDIVYTASNLMNGDGEIIPANLISLEAPISIEPGTSNVAKGTINPISIPSAGYYLGTIQISGTDGETGSPLSATTNIQYLLNWPTIYLPSVFR